MFVYVKMEYAIGAYLMQIVLILSKRNVSICFLASLRCHNRWGPVKWQMLLMSHFNWLWSIFILSNLHQ